MSVPNPNAPPVLAPAPRRPVESRSGAGESPSEQNDAGKIAFSAGVARFTSPGSGRHYPTERLWRHGAAICYGKAQRSKLLAAAVDHAHAFYCRGKGFHYPSCPHAGNGGPMHRRADRRPCHDSGGRALGRPGAAGFSRPRAGIFRAKHLRNGPKRTSSKSRLPSLT